MFHILSRRCSLAGLLTAGTAAVSLGQTQSPGPKSSGGWVPIAEPVTLSHPAPVAPAPLPPLIFVEQLPTRTLPEVIQTGRKELDMRLGNQRSKTPR